MFNKCFTKSFSFICSLLFCMQYIHIYVARYNTSKENSKVLDLFFIVDDEIRSVSVNFFTLHQEFENLKEYS